MCPHYEKQKKKKRCMWPSCPNFLGHCKGHVLGGPLHDAANLTLKRLLVCANAVGNVDVRFARAAVCVALFGLSIRKKTGRPLLLASLLKQNLRRVFITPLDIPHRFSDARDWGRLVHSLGRSPEARPILVSIQQRLKVNTLEVGSDYRMKLTCITLYIK